MAVTNFSPLLGLALPTTGDLSGTWGVTVNDAITSLLDSAIAGATSITSDVDVTLSTTNGAANQARNAILLCTGGRTGVRTITAPAQSKAYVVVNNTTGGFGVKLVGSGPTSGVTVGNGRAAVVAWNGSDFDIVATNDIAAIEGLGASVAAALANNVGTAGSVVVNGGALGTPSSGTLTNTTGLPIVAGTTGTLSVSRGGTGVTSTPSNGQLLIGNGSGYSVANLTAGSGISVTNSSGGVTIAATGAGGTVTSVGLSAPALFSVSGSPVTGSGTLALSYSGTALPVANGGTGVTSAPSNGQLLIGNGTGYSVANLTAGSGINITNSSGGVTIAATTSGGTVTSVGLSAPSFLTVSGSPVTSSGTLTLSYSGTALPVANGGTGATTLTGIVKGSGTSAFTAATAGTDYVAPGTATTFTATQTFNGSTSAIAAVLKNASEAFVSSATAATGTVNFDVTTQSVLYYTANASGNWTVNVRGNASTTLDSLLSTGQSITIGFLVTTGATAYYNTAFQIDGNSVTPKWSGGIAPGSGNASSIESYVYVIMKTGSASFTVLASRTQFK